MSIHDPKLSGVTSENGQAAAETADIASLEGLAGLVEDMTNIHMNRTRENLEQAVRDRLGPNVTLEDAERLVRGFAAAI